MKRNQRPTTRKTSSFWHEWEEKYNHANGTRIHGETEERDGEFEMRNTFCAGIMLGAGVKDELVRYLCLGGFLSLVKNAKTQHRNQKKNQLNGRVHPFVNHAIVDENRISFASVWHFMGFWFCKCFDSHGDSSFPPSLWSQMITYFRWVYLATLQEERFQSCDGLQGTSITQLFLEVASLCEQIGWIDWEESSVREIQSGVLRIECAGRAAEEDCGLQRESR